MIALLGYPRCGTTWAASILSRLAHPLVMEPFNLHAVNFAGNAGKWGPGVYGLVPPEDKMKQREIQTRLTALSAKWACADLTQLPEGQQQICAAIEELKQYAPPGMAAYKQIWHVREFAERWADKIVYVVRNPMGTLASQMDIIRGTRRPPAWPAMLAAKVKEFHPEAWDKLPAVNSIPGNLAKAYKIRSENDWRSLQPMGAKLVRFEDLIVNFDVAWGDLLAFLELEPTDEFLDALHESRVTPRTHHNGREKQIRDARAMMEAIETVFEEGWDVGYGSA